MPKEIVKLSVNLPKDAVDVLRALAEEESITLTEALRRSISTQKFVHDTVESGSTILIEDPDQKSLRQVVFK